MIMRSGAALHHAVDSIDQWLLIYANETSMWTFKIGDQHHDDSQQ